MAISIIERMLAIITPHVREANYYKNRLAAEHAMQQYRELQTRLQEVRTGLREHAEIKDALIRARTKDTPKQLDTLLISLCDAAWQTASKHAAAAVQGNSHQEFLDYFSFALETFDDPTELCIADRYKLFWNVAKASRDPFYGILGTLAFRLSNQACQEHDSHHETLRPYIIEAHKQLRQRK